MYVCTYQGCGNGNCNVINYTMITFFVNGNGN